MQESRNYAFDKRNFGFALGWLVLLRHGLESRVAWGEPEKRMVTHGPASIS